MTILAGVVSRVPGKPIGVPTINALRDLISRNKADAVVEFIDRSAFLAKVDIGLFGAQAAHRDIHGNVSLLAGEPLLHDPPATRAVDLETLHAQWSRAEWGSLAKCRGTFCAIHYGRDDHVLSLVADKLGVRPLYYWVGPESVVFATALRILEGMDSVPKQLDLQGATEIAAFGYPLGERTGYAGISTIRAGQIVQISPTSVHKSEYWRWDSLPVFPGDDDEISKEAYKRFIAAITLRLRFERDAVAFLSGGLDSRSIVAGLRQLGCTVDTLNFAPEGTYDRVFARQAAKILGTRHHELTPPLDGEKPYTGGAYNQPRVVTWFDSDEAQAAPRRVVWSGDGGSVGLGHVYLDRETVHLARTGNIDAAVASFARYNGWGIPTRIFQSDIASTISKLPTQGICEELALVKCADAGRAFHLFLMLNDQRRHLAGFYENSDVDRLELQLPFFDSEFLQLILTRPVRGFLRHEFYMEWLKNFAPSATSVPWQAYPNHVPCPLPMPAGLRYQWTDYLDRRQMRSLRTGLLREIEELSATRHFPTSILNKGKFRLVTWLTRMGIRDYSYFLRIAAVYLRYS